MANDLIAQARTRRLVRDDLQPDLSRRWLEPALPELLELSRGARREVDADLRRRYAGFDTPEGLNLQTYPLGWCCLISEGVWARLQTAPLLKQLTHRGLLFRRVFVIQRGKFFQNAIQLGDRFLDAANDSADPKLPSVVCTTLEVAEAENLDSWRRFVEVAEKYYQVKVIPNRWFPLLFPIIPFLALRPSGRLEALHPQDLLFLLDAGEQFRRAHELVDDSELMNRPIPEGVEATLSQHLVLAAANFPVEYRPTDRAGLAQVIADWDAVTHLGREQFQSTLATTLRLAGEMAQALRKANLQVPLR